MKPLSEKETYYKMTHFGMFHKEDVAEAVKRLKLDLLNEGENQFMTSQEFNPNIMMKIIDEIFGEFK